MSSKLKQVNEAWGMIDTTDGNHFSLEGDHVICVPKVWKRKIFPITDLPRLLEGRVVKSIGEDLIGDEAHNLINGVEYNTAEKVNEFFNLGTS